MKESPLLQNIEFRCCDYLTLEPNNTVIYCDPPYNNTTGYKRKFDSNSFYNWLKANSKTNTIIISEYSMPDEYKCIWEKDITFSMQHSKIGDMRTERLWIRK